MRYGIGTYIKQLTNSLLKYSEVSVIIVNYHSLDYNELKIINMRERLTEVFIPAAVMKYEYVYFKQKYAARIVDLLSFIVPNYNNIIFMVNYIDALSIVKILRLKYKFPIVSVIHSAQWQSIYSGNKKKFIESWLNKSDFQDSRLQQVTNEKEMYELSDKVISVTSYMKEFVIKYYNIPESKVDVVQNGIDNTIFHIPDKKERIVIKEGLGFNKDEKIILFSGRLDESKGISYLLESFSEVIKYYDGVRLVLVGEESGLTNINYYLTKCANIWGKVTFTGFIEYEKILKFYQIADVGVIPSVYDHCPYVALEMIGHCIPVIISNTEGLNEILKKDQCIYLMPKVDNEGNISFDIKEISKAILTLLNSDNLKGDIFVKYSSSLISSKFSDEQMSKKVVSTLMSINSVCV